MSSARTSTSSTAMATASPASRRRRGGEAEVLTTAPASAMEGACTPSPEPREMKFFVDTADIAEIEDLAATGLVDGVTTNPSLVAKSGRNFLDAIVEICSVVKGPVSAEVGATEHVAMLAEGRTLVWLVDKVDGKVPLDGD